MVSNNKNNKSFSWMNPKLEIRETNNCEKGVFAKKMVREGELLTIFGGYIITAKEEENLPPKLNDYGLQIHEDYVLGIKKFSEVGDSEYFNHSCDPNAGFKGQIFLVSMKKIKANEEITFDYAMVLSRSKGVKPYSLNCYCGNINCRKVITDSDWKKKDIQDKYKGYFQWYIQEKINKKNGKL